MKQQLFLFDLDTAQFITTKLGDAIRLFPFGEIHKSGKVIQITKEFAAKFKLPHFQPPIKLGSHKDDQPAGGHITALEVRSDGIYAIPEWNEQGLQAIKEGHYKYHSPEVIFNGWIEGNEGKTAGPVITGLALLHAPHLGEAAAMYTSNVSPKNPTKEKSAMTVEVPESLWDQIVARFNLGSGQNPDPTPEPEPVDVTADPAFIELKAERDKFEAEAKEAQDKEQAEKLAAEIRTEFEDKDFGTAFIELGQAEESAQQLSTMTPEQRDWVMRNFKALSKQIEEAALGEKGDDGINTNTEEHAFDAEIKSIMEDKGIAYHEAFTVAQQLKPDLFTAYVEQRNKDGK